MECTTSLRWTEEDKVVGDLFVALGIDKGECLKEVEKGNSSAASFKASVDEHICERDHKLYEEELSSEVKPLYKTLSKEVGFKSTFMV